MSILKRSNLRWLTLLVFAALPAQLALSQERARRIPVGAPMPPFSLADVEGKTFTYDPNQPHVLGLVLMKAGQEHFDRVMSDLDRVTSELRSAGKAFDCPVIVCGPGGREFVAAQEAETEAHRPVLLDPDFALWGKLGIIAAPTAIIVGADGNVQWTEAGYGYDFTPAFHAQMRQAVGLDDTAEASIRVETLENSSDRARLERHVQMARMLAQRGRLDTAIEEFQRARALDPNAIDVVLELGELLCQAGESRAACDVVATVESKVRTDPEKARVLLVRGWANRQMGQYAEAESLLSQAVELNPQAARALYELGRTRQETGDTEGALACYQRALAIVFQETEKLVPNRP